MTSNFSKDITLHDLETRFDLRLNEDSQFFPEWQTDLPDIDHYEKRFLDNVKASYVHRTKYYNNS